MKKKFKFDENKCEKGLTGETSRVIITERLVKHLESLKRLIAKVSRTLNDAEPQSKFQKKDSKNSKRVEKKRLTTRSESGTIIKLSR
jgi:hypothetical protein